MFRNYLVTALRNLERNRLYAAISILGLAVAFAAALLIAQFVRGELSYDHWLTGYQQVYKLAETIQHPGQAAIVSDEATSNIATRLRVQYPAAVGVARIRWEPLAPLRRRPGDAIFTDRSFAWADPDVFKVFPLPALGGDLKTALEQPDTVVITRRIARKYFGRDLPIGEMLQVQALPPQPPGAPQVKTQDMPWHSMRVTAVLEDLPPNTNLTTEIWGSGRSAYSTLATLDRAPPGYINNFTFVRLPPTATAADLQRAVDAAAGPDVQAYTSFGGRFAFHLIPLADLHLTPVDNTAEVIKPSGSRSNAYAIAGVGALIVLVAAINFVTLMTARAARRAMEVGVRKAAGAGRADLMAQFIGEALMQVAFSALIAVALAELLIKPFAAFSQRGLELDWLHDPALLAGVVGATLAVGLMAAIYPALVLSSFRPAAVLKGGPIQTAGSAPARQALVVVQFAVLVGLILTTTTLYRQTQFALARGFGGGGDGGRIIRVLDGCNNAFPDAVRRLRGVASAACSSMNALNTPNAKNGITVQIGARREDFDRAPVDFGFLELYGMTPLAGRVFSREHGEDAALADRQHPGQPTAVINEAAARRLGYADPKAAVGHALVWGSFADPKGVAMARSTIVGVVRDMPMSVRSLTDPFVYYIVPDRLGTLSIRLTGEDIPGAVRAIEQAWRRTGHPQPIQATFMSQYQTSLYLDLIIQSATIGLCAALAVLIACLGLFALSAFTTERRTKEIGVRKAMGANTRDVVALLLWQFTLPVLIATALALPLGALAMGWWLHGFAYHVPLSAWTFVLAGLAAVAIAWITVSYQSFMTARAKPASALRYE